MSSGKIQSAKKIKPARRYGLHTSPFKPNTGLTKSYRPGQHGKNPRRKTPFGIRKDAMKVLQLFYGGSKLRVSQLENYFKEADRRTGNTGDNLISILESRLDNLVYRMKLGSTIYQARQLVVHSHILVNGKRVNKPSMICKPGDEITIKSKSKDLAVVLESINDSSRNVPDYMSVSEDKLIGKYIRVPSIDEIPFTSDVNINLVVEYLS